MTDKERQLSYLKQYFRLKHDIHDISDFIILHLSDEVSTISFKVERRYVIPYRHEIKLIRCIDFKEKMMYVDIDMKVIREYVDRENENIRLGVYDGETYSNDDDER